MFELQLFRYHDIGFFFSSMLVFLFIFRLISRTCARGQLKCAEIDKLVAWVDLEVHAISLILAALVCSS